MNNIVKQQLEAYMQALVPLNDIKLPSQQVSIDASAVVKLVDDSMAKLRDLIDTECKKMVVDIAKDSSIAIDSILRVIIDYLRNPDQEMDVQTIDSCYENYKNGFADKYRVFFSNNFTENDSAFLPMTQTLEELKSESKQLAERLSDLNKSSVVTQAQSQSQENQAIKSKTAAAAQIKQQTSGTQSKSGEGLISRWLSKFKGKDDGYVKTDLGKDSSGMRWDPDKKKYSYV